MTRNYRFMMILTAIFLVTGAAVFVVKTELKTWFFQSFVVANNHQPVILFGKFQSFSRPEELIALMQKHGIEFEVEAERGLASVSEVPGFKFSYLYLDNYFHLDSPGRLSLVFYNSRLMEVRFEPDLPEQYIGRVRSNLKVTKGQTVVTQGHVEVEISDPVDGEAAVNFVDRRLKAEENAWLAWFS